MRRSALFSVVVILGLLPPSSVSQQAGVTREGNRFVRDFHGNAPPSRRLRINAHGPVTVHAGIAPSLQYSVRLSVQARTENEARRVLQQYSIHQESRGDTLVLTAPPGPVISTVFVKAPRLEHVVVSTSDGAVEATGVEGPVEIDTGGGEIAADRIRGDCKLVTGAGDIRVGTCGSLQCSSGAGKILVGTIQGSAVMETFGGDITVTEVAGPLRADTGGGAIHISKAGAAVNVTTGGGQIIVERAGGIVTARNMAGPVKVGAAAGVQCESASGGINVSNITGAMNVSTSLGNIMASLLSGKLFAESFLATGNGDITVFIPSNVGVNIRAQNDLADTTRRIAVEFPGVRVRRQGRLIVAEGPVNGGGPLLQISATVGTIFIRKQQ
uniref:Adhesin domain-containing protein n=1 Tax=Solibacter usitatus (strain Ellin6076) TaxID=234267 RepID=Q01UK1_SOLUE